MVNRSREQCVTQIADYLAVRFASHPLRVAIDGRTASGKTTFADELAGRISARKRAVIRTSIDGFHKSRAERYARGRYSAEGYYYDARDLAAVRRLLLDPLGPGGNLYYRTASFDLAKDEPIAQQSQLAPDDSMLLVDGTFLQRSELRSGWDVVLFIDVAEAVAFERGIKRDSETLGGVSEARKMYQERYGPAFEIYDSACNPKENADIVIDNNDVESPKVHVRR